MAQGDEGDQAPRFGTPVGRRRPKLSELASAARVATGRPTRAEGAVVLAYHDIRTDGRDYHVTPSQFRAHLELALTSGLRFVALAALVDAVESGAPVDGLATVTFDDGLVGVAEHAAPILDELGLPATIFAVSDRLGASPDWWEGARRTLSARELREVCSASQLSLGSHSRTHRSLPTLDHDVLRDELDGSRRRLEDVVGHPVDLLAYPSGHHDQRVRTAARAAGYRAGFTFLNGRVLPSQDPFRLPRLTMGHHHHRMRLAVHLARPAASWPSTQLETVS